MAAQMKTIVEDDPTPWAPTCSDIDPIEEQIMMHKMGRYINKLESSQFYHYFRDQLETPPISEHLEKVLGSESKMDMVIYGIGKIEMHEAPRWQLSLAILMKTDFEWIGVIKVFDPLLSATECKILEALGCSVLLLDENGKRKALQPTIFFMPYCDFALYENLLQANWTPHLLSNIILLGNRLKTLDIHHTKHISTAKKFTLEFLIKHDHHCAFRDLSWQLFNPCTETDLQFIDKCAFNGGILGREKCDYCASKGDMIKIERSEISNKVEIPKETYETERLTNLVVDLNGEKALLQKVEMCIENLESSQFYLKFRDQLQNPPISDLLVKVLGQEKKMQIVIYGIGKLEENAMLHICLAILMKKDFKWIESIEVFDRNISTSECHVLETLGSSVLSVREYEMRQVLKPTIFFMLDCSLEIYNNILKTNWKPHLLSNMVVLCGKNFKEWEEVVDTYTPICPPVLLRSILLNSTGHVLATQGFKNEFKCKTIFDYQHHTSQDLSGWDDYYDAFYHSTWHFFNYVTETELQFMDELQKGDIA